MGGLWGETYWGWLYVDVLAIHEKARNQGWGTRLMAMAEEEALRRGCHHAHLDTFDFQALPFYQKLGYTVFGTLDQFPGEHKRYFQKVLGVGQVLGKHYEQHHRPQLTPNTQHPFRCNPSPIPRPERKATLRFGQRHLSLMSLAVVVVIVFGLFAGLFSMYRQFKITRDLSIADSNLHALSKGICTDLRWTMTSNCPKPHEWTDQVVGLPVRAARHSPGGRLAYLRGEDEFGNPIHYVYNDLAEWPQPGSRQPEPETPKRMISVVSYC